jgi:hypothetical protein
MKISLLLLSFVFAALSISAQVNPQCPTISVEEPAGLSRPGESISFSVTVKPTESKLTYKWSVSSGVIISGQGTPSIQVRFDEAHEPSPTATVEIGGLPEECPRTASESTSIDRPPQPTKLDTFSLSLNSGDDGRLKSIARALSNEPTAQLYVLVPSCGNLWSIGSLNLFTVTLRGRESLSWRSMAQTKSSKSGSFRQVRLHHLNAKHAIYRNPLDKTVLQFQLWVRPV